MYKQLYFLFCTFLIIPAKGIGQELSKHQWKERVILIFGTHEHFPEYKQQVLELSSDPRCLKERRLVTYQILPDKYKYGSTKGSWTPSSEIDQELMKSSADFEIILIGLDEGIKLRQNNPISLQELFSLIDGMPMRKIELKTENKG